MSQYILDCTNAADTTCTMVPYSPPPATVEHYALGPWWVIIVAAVVVLAVVAATAIVRYRAHEERNETARTRILHPLQKCPTCGEKLEAAA